MSMDFGKGMHRFSRSLESGTKKQSLCDGAKNSTLNTLLAAPMMQIQVFQMHIMVSIQKNQ